MALVDGNAAICPEGFVEAFILGDKLCYTPQHFGDFEVVDGVVLTEVHVAA
jgi:hypothetical protein